MAAYDPYHNGVPVPGEYVEATDEQGRQIKKTNCHFCGYLCGFHAVVDAGKVVDLQPDPTRYPYDEKILAGCRRWRMNLDVLDAPDRVNFPLRRVGERGSNQWQRVTWDEALDEIAQRLGALKEQHGPGTLASMIGGPHTSFWPLHRFMNLFGSPNNMGIGQICWNPRIWMDMLTFGWTVEHDIRPGETECVFIWGTNPADSDNSAFWQALRSLDGWEIPLVVVDPRYTQAASLANVWLPVRPGMDCTLALGLLHVIVEEDLVDHDFVDTWCHGFDELVANVEPYDPETVGQLCGLDPEDIRKAARLWGKAKSAALVSGRGVDQSGQNVAPTHRAICSLRAITGNVDKPGACVLAEESEFVPEVQLEMTYALTPENRALCLNTPYTPLQSYEGYEYANALTAKLGRHMPTRYLCSAHPDLVLHAMETGEPYPVRALIVEATNPLLTYGDTHRVFNALMGLDLIVVLEYYMTPTASLADFVLPSAGAIERTTFQAHGGVANMVYGGAQAVNPYYDRKDDYSVFRELGLRMGQEEHWPWDSFAAACEAALAVTGMEWDSFCSYGMYFQPPDYYKHLKPGEDGTPQGFATTTGKVELASESLDHLGGPRVPKQSELISLCSEELRKKGTHVRLATGARKQPYNASMYMNNAKFRKNTPAPCADMSQATADMCGVKDGDNVVLATDFGEARFKCRITKMRDGVVSADYGWWHPEWTPGAPYFGGMWDSNINCLTSVDRSKGEEMIGTWSYNAIDCVVWKTDEPLTFSLQDVVEKHGINVVADSLAFAESHQGISDPAPVRPLD
ncbi:MAG: molybdopterin-dependent oxidoreductase [Coriobacteriia bacterium]|nr:molybdopterin-dependent oxidoreductase [Coriobacteriia bacterium]